ncbi:hypothetical protein RJ45_07005 [Photobacterium gaetbulicola]|uniref:Uncharacterized protein n=1 Tax=Photobacterium gaetbulicola TaxID=1295392 RepID=A0A0B9G6F6_9GAMM|nr:hypothetical protein [Photobacterium gaetbulicola]KHT64278.1 hypothetical protein RJ45_07005 [Photobacterium gaetbulicola]
MFVLSLSSGLLLSSFYLNPTPCLPPSDGQSSLRLVTDSYSTDSQECLPLTLSDSYVGEAKGPSQLEWKLASKPKESFWDNWAREFDSPFLSSTVSSSFYGLGVWMPEKFAEDDLLDVDEIKELIKKYGLQMSFGFGGENGRSPRLRLDYRWHEDRDLEDVFIQVEIPFQ